MKLRNESLCTQGNAAGRSGLEDASKLSNLLTQLARRGWSDADVRKLAGENLLRVLDAAGGTRQTALSD